MKTEDFSNIQRSVTKSVTVTFLFRLEGLKLNDTDWINDFKEKRTQYGVSQNRLAVMAGISREYVSRIESGKVALTEEIKGKFTDALEKLNPENPLEMVLDYVRIRFPTQDVRHVVEDILQLKLDVMIHEDYGFYSYAEHYVLGDVFVLTSPDKEKGTLLELKGKGCRQMESYLLAQERSWYDFLMDCLVEGGIMKRLDLAINDRTGILDIPELIEKCKNDECVSVFRHFRFYASGEISHQRERNHKEMGTTMYIGSMKSEVYFCIYEKNYEQYIKAGVPLEEAPVKNRFEIRLKNERAYYAVRDLLTYYDAERTAFSIINRYVRFVDKEENKPVSEWKLNEKWAWFIGEGRPPLKLTTKPEPYTLGRTLRWISRQVDPTLLMLEEIAKKTGVNYLKEIRQYTKLTEKHEQIIRQQTTTIEEIVLSDEERNEKDVGIF